MTRSTNRHIGAVLNILEVSAHVLVTPRVIARKAGDIIPLVIGRPEEIHGVNLRTTTQRRTTRIIQARTRYDTSVIIFNEKEKRSFPLVVRPGTYGLAPSGGSSPT